MERHSNSLRASKILPLMVLAQAQLSSGLPFVPRINGETGQLEDGPKPHFAPKHVMPDGGIESGAWPSTSCTDEDPSHWTQMPAMQIADGQVQVPTSRIAAFSKAIADLDPKDFHGPGIFTATEWNTVSTATVRDWPESKPEPPAGEILTSTVWSTASTATITNWNGPASESVGPVLDDYTSTVWNTVSTETITNRPESTSAPVAPLTTSESVAPPQFEAESSNATSLSSSSSAPMALEYSIKKTYSKASTSTDTIQLQEEPTEALPQFADATSSVDVEAKAVKSAEPKPENGTSASYTITSTISSTSTLVYGTITLTYTTRTDTTSGFPATAETVTPAQSSSSRSTVDFYNPFPPTTTQEDISSETKAAASYDESSTNTIEQHSDTRASPDFYSEPTSEATKEGSDAQASATPLQNSASESATPETTPLSVPDSSLKMLSTSAVQTADPSSVMNNQGSTTPTVISSLNMDGRSSAIPFPTSLSAASVTLSLNETAMLSNVGTSTKLSLSVSNIFQPIATDAPPEQLSRRNDHPAPRKGIQPQEKKLQTNKFYSNFFLEGQDLPSFVFPYSVVWANGSGATGSYGMAVSHTERQQFAGGETDPVTGAWKFYASPIGVHSLILSSTELSNDTELTTDSVEAFSINVNLAPRGDNSSKITYPLVQGMGFVTARYTKSTPVIASGVGISNITYVGEVDNALAHKYRIELNNGFSWVAYVSPQDSSYDANGFNLLDQNTIQGPSGFEGIIQVAKIPVNTSDAVDVYDSAAGAYPTSGSISGTTDGTHGRYTMSWKKGGAEDRELLMFALPHHMQSLSNETKGGVTDVKLMTTVKGNSVAIRGDSWTLEENNLPVDMEFAPWQPGHGSIRALSAEAKALINEAATSELRQNMSEMSDLDSMYYSGKELGKYASIVFAANDMAQNASLAQDGLDRLKTAMARFVDNKQKFPLVYEEGWGGAASSASYDTGDSGQDFGNTFYNDHHFHYGYHVYAAAVIAYLDPSWLEAGTNKAWVDMLVRDYANSITDDPYFPFSRNFDWYHGHSWAKGLFASADGKDQESSSEDTMASYAIKMWGSVCGDQAMEARGNLMLAVQARALDNYYLYRDSNEVQPKEYIGNRAAGILFENKIDHTTYFGANIEYIQGINMIPIMPFSTITRRRDFVQTEWDQFFAKNISSFTDGWRGILMSNLALIDPTASYDFFANNSGDYNDKMLDGGASRTWYLAYAAGLKEAEDAGYESPYANSTSKRSVDADIPRPTKRWVNGQLVDCDESNQDDMEAGVLQMYGELDDETAAQPQQETVNGKRWVNGQLVDCDESNQDDMEAGILTMYGELDTTSAEQETSPPPSPEPAQAETLRGSERIARRNRIGASGSPRLRQRARG
ncbi:hypothetical protein Q7P37_007720 [Cladosporium fusiforme]